MSFATCPSVAPPWCSGKHRAAHPERRGFESRLSGSSSGSSGSSGSFGSTWRGRGCRRCGLGGSPSLFFSSCCTFLCGAFSAFFERCSHQLALEPAAGAAAPPARATALRSPLLPLGLAGPSVLCGFPPFRRRLRLGVAGSGSAITPPTRLLCSPPLSGCLQLPPAFLQPPPAPSSLTPAPAPPPRFSRPARALCIGAFVTACASAPLCCA